MGYSFHNAVCQVDLQDLERVGVPITAQDTFVFILKQETQAIAVHYCSECYSFYQSD